MIIFFSRGQSVPASSCVAFYGLRYDVRPEQIEALEGKSDIRLVAARRVGLKYYWGNFGAPGERWVLFIGARLGVLGAEDQGEVQLGGEELLKLMRDTEAKLSRAGFEGPPSLFLHWQSEG
jgi:hypothetical protein